jgi:uncharacterized Tic20 family protein
MNQPELGLKVAELRRQKGFTQELLAEKCEVNSRTIQRVESGEVDPRAYTLQCLSRELDYDFLKDNHQGESLWLLILHLSSIIPLLIIPLLLWSWKKNQNNKIDQQGRVVLNFQITMMLLLFLGGFLMLFLPAVLPFIGKAIDESSQNMMMFEMVVFCAPMPMMLIGIYCTYLGVANAIRALTNNPIRYPLIIPFVR